MRDDSGKCYYMGHAIPKSFESLAHFEQISAELEADGELVKVRSPKPATSVGFIEHWFCSKKLSSAVRVIEPDPPFPGRCELVDDSDLAYIGPDLRIDSSSNQGPGGP